MQSAVKKCSTTYTWGFAIPIPLSCIPFLLAADFKSADSQSLVLSEGDTESISPSEAACGMAQENIFFKISNKFILSIFLCINTALN